MRRYARMLILIGLLVAAAVIILGFQRITIGDFERGGDTLLGLSLGLDLQGGIFLVYQANLEDPDTGERIIPTKLQMEDLQRNIENRVNTSGLGQPFIQLLGEDRLEIQLPGVSDPERALRIIGETAQLVFKHRMLGVARELDEISGEDIVSVSAGTVEFDESGASLLPGELESGASPEAAEAQAGLTSEATAGTSTQQAEGLLEGEAPQEAATTSPPLLIVEFTEGGAQKFAEVVGRLNESLASSLGRASSGSFSPPSQLDISLDGPEGTQPLRYQLSALSMQRLGSTTQFAFTFPRIDGVSTSTELTTSGREVFDVEEAQALLGDSPVIHFSEIQDRVDEVINLTGDDLARAYPSQQSGSGVPIVVVEFKDRGTKIWADITSEIEGSDTDQIAIFLDDQELISPGVVTAILSGSTIISGNFTLERVRDIALQLESGRLPVPIELIRRREVDAILGSDSLSKSVVAGLVGLALVLLFMTLYYRVPGILSSLALLLYALMLLAIFKILPVTLTLSGVAAAILSVGMAVDANILIFERMKEELRAGRTLMSAVNIGFNRAWPAIRDSNVSTLITCGILFWFSDQLGATIVQGFAATLAIGVGLSMFSAITVSRTLIRVAATTGLARKLGLFAPSGAADLPQQQEQAAAAQRS